MTPQLYTPVAVPPFDFRIDFGSRVVTIGSCFADEIGRRLADGGFAVSVNPFGTLYNPASVASALERIIGCHTIAEADLVERDGLWHSWHHHGSFSRPTAAETLEVCNSGIRAAHEALKEATLLMVTFGTAWVYELVGSGQWIVDSACHHTPSDTSSVVANCHKVPAERFVRRRMTVDEIVGIWTPLLKKLAEINPRLTTLFTVSPIRHMADGAHGNQLSKSVLLLAVDALPAHYFPAYEIVLDELRDYRFFGPDMAHPTALAADIVYDRFQQATMSPAIIQQAHNNAKAARRANHIPLH